MIAIIQYTYNFIYLLINVYRLNLQISYHICEVVYHIVFGIKEKSVANDIVLITGAGHGIGKELALQYARLGATVVCLDINQQLNEDTANTIRKTVKNCSKENIVYAYQCDVSNREEILKVTKIIKKDVGDVTILINNAGIMPCHAFLNYTTEEITQIFNLNILAHIWMVKAFLPSMIQRNYGHIVALSSIAGLAGFSNIVPYSASKFAVAGFMDALSSELSEESQGKSLIKFTTVYPFMANTGLCKKPKLNERLPFVLLPPEDVATQIIKAQRKNIKEMSIPSYWKCLIRTNRLLPEKSIKCIRDFFNLGVETDD